MTRWSQARTSGGPAEELFCTACADRALIGANSTLRAVSFSAGHAQRIRNRLAKIWLLQRERDGTCNLLPEPRSAACMAGPAIGTTNNTLFFSRGSPKTGPSAKQPLFPCTMGRVIRGTPADSSVLCACTCTRAVACVRCILSIGPGDAALTLNVPQAKGRVLEASSLYHRLSFPHSWDDGNARPLLHPKQITARPMCACNGGRLRHALDTTSRRICMLACAP